MLVKLADNGSMLYLSRCSTNR